MADEAIDVADSFVAEPGSEALAEPLFTYGISRLTWDDLMHASLVSYGWNQGVNTALSTSSVATSLFKAKYPSDEAINRLFRFRAKKDDKVHEQCLLLVLEAQMLLRELAEYKQRDPPRLYQQIREQIAKLPADDSDEEDLLARIAELRQIMMKALKRNNELEKRQKVLEFKAGLLIQHRTSVVEIERKKKKKKKGEDEDIERPTFYKDQKKMEAYGNLFFQLRTEPRYLAGLAYLIPPSTEEKQAFAETVILTLYANAFSPLEELMLMDLLKLSIEKEVNQNKNVNEFVSNTDSVVPLMIVSYNKRKQGKRYMKENFGNLIGEVIKSDDVYGADPSGKGFNKALLTKRCDKFFPVVLNTMEKLPFGLRYLCRVLKEKLSEKFPKADPNDLLRTVGYFIYYRFVGLALLAPDEFGLCEHEDLMTTTTLNLISLSTVLKAVFSDLGSIREGPLVAMNDWIESKVPEAKEYLKQAIDVPNAEDFLQVSKYGQLAKKEKDSIVILLYEICSMHKLVAANVKELIVDDEDPIKILIDELGTVPRCPSDDETEVQLVLDNRFPPRLNKTDIKKNLKIETIDGVIGVFRKIPGFSGDTLLEILVRMKLHCRKHGDKELADQVNQVIANLQNLAKHGLVSAENGFNSVLKDIQLELEARGRRKGEHLKEIERLKTAITELDEQKKSIDTKVSDFEAYLQSVRKNAEEQFESKSKKFEYKDLQKLKVIHDSEIPASQQSKVKFTITQVTMEEFEIQGKIKNLPGFSRDFHLELEKLLEAKEDGDATFDTGKGLELNVASTLIFLNKEFFKTKK